MKISISATNPCHLYDLAKALHEHGALGRYYSGYPRWRLNPPAEFPLVARPFRTVATYAALRLPAKLRPAPHRLFRWQDAGFDQAIAGELEGDTADFLHALPGQARATFRAARARGIATVLNHASGPVKQQLALIEEEYRRAGVSLAAHHAFDEEYFRREAEEYALADRHCVASSIVQQQLVAAGVPRDRIIVVPYAADSQYFHPPSAAAPRDPLRLVFAGQLTLRKGLRTAFAAIERLRKSRPFRLDLFGPTGADMWSTLATVENQPWLRVHGPVTHAQLGEIFRSAGALVLPSWEEAFGLVVAQALACGLPCIVSDRVGASDLIVPRRNGSVFPVGDADALAGELAWWADHQAMFHHEPFTWADAATRLLDSAPPGSMTR